MMSLHKKQSSGFTLIEILVVVSIIGMLSSVILVSLQGARDKGRIGAGLKFATYNYRAIGDRLIGSWQFNECSGASVVDESINKNTLTLFGPTWSSTETPNKPGCSVRFSTANGDSAGAALVQTAVSQYTISAWIKTNRADGLINPIVQDRGSGIGRSITLSTSYQSTTNGVPECGLDTDNTYVGVYAPGNLVNDNKWHNITCVFTSTSGSAVVPGNFALFVDGIRTSVTSVSVGPVVNSPLTGSGGTNIGYHETEDVAFEGYIDDVKIYNASLLASEVQQIYLTGLRTHPVAIK